MMRIRSMAVLAAAALALPACRGAGYRSDEDQAPPESRLNPNTPTPAEQSATSPVPQTPPPSPASPRPAPPPAAAPPAGGAKAATGGRTGFFRKLHQSPQATFADTCRAMSLLFFDEDKGGDFESTRRVLIENGVVATKWTYGAESPVTKGMISYMVCRALGIKGGVLMWTLGTSQRYGLRECTWNGIVLDGNVDQYITGGELLAVLSRAEGYKKYGFVPGFMGRQADESKTSNQ